MIEEVNCNSPNIIDSKINKREESERKGSKGTYVCSQNEVLSFLVETFLFRTTRVTFQYILCFKKVLFCMTELIGFGKQGKDRSGVI